MGIADANFLVRYYSDCVYPPFNRLGAQALPFNVPSKRNNTLGGNVDVCVCLVA